LYYARVFAFNEVGYSLPQIAASPQVRFTLTRA
jgi:hypothetical protein